MVIVVNLQLFNKKWQPEIQQSERTKDKKNFGDAEH